MITLFSGRQFGLQYGAKYAPCISVGIDKYWVMAEVRKSEHEGAFGEKKREQQKKNDAEFIQEYWDSGLY